MHSPSCSSPLRRSLAKFPLYCLSLLALAAWAPAGAADSSPLPLVSPVFGDHMVLQRGKPVRVWGWAAAGETVQVVLNGRQARVVAAPDGRWQAEVKVPPAGGPYTVLVRDGEQKVTVNDVLVGDVWLCGGQSNMELPLSRARNGAEEIQAANHPDIRFFTVAAHVAYAPAALPKGMWKVCSPQSVAEGAGFSAVAYYFGRKLEGDLHVPIGLIQDCMGGTPAESWMSPQTLESMPDFAVPLAEIKRLHALGGPEYGSFLMHWLDEYDAGTKNTNWAAADLDDSHWPTVAVPGDFAELGVAQTPAICWVRQEFTLPDPLPAGKTILHLGVVEKMDTAYLNGQWVGASSWVENPRAYVIKDGVLRPGRNVLAVRVFKMKPQGGFLSPAGDLKLTLGDQMTVPLAGAWKGALSADARPPHALPLTFENYPTMPGVLYDGMINPIAPLSLRGAIWYQGEANFERAHQYRTLLPALIHDWRAAFRQGDFPFYIVSLPAFMARKAQPGEDAWAELREAQALTARTVKHTALAVTVDTGEAGNIHPKDKKIVGERLALCALANEYGKDVAWAGPTFASLKVLPGALKLRFDHADGGLVGKGNQLKEFSVAGSDRRWQWAEAKLQGNAIVVSSPLVPNPVAARYAWQANPEATLYNGEGLPAVPFRTDDWPESTENHAPW